MPIIADFQSWKEERSNQIRLLSRILAEEKLIVSIDPLESAANGCMNCTDPDNWSYSIPNLQFTSLPQESFHHSRPEGIETLDMKLNYSVVAPWNSRIGSVDHCEDPFRSLNCDIVIGGTKIVADRSASLRCAWHFDRDVRTASGNAPNAVHPFYHFQHGGNQIRGIDDFGLHLVLDPPRIAHPPLDGPLIIDFLLSNYFGEKWLLLRRSADYRRIMRDSQEWCWKPYVLSLSTRWEDDRTFPNWTAQNIWPQIAILTPRRDALVATLATAQELPRKARKAEAREVRKQEKQNKKLR